MCDIHVHVIKRLHCMEYVYTISSIQKKKCSDILRNVRIYIDTYYDERNMKNRPITQRVRVSYKIQFNFFPSFFFSLFIHTFKACSSGVENLFNQYLSLFFFFWSQTDTWDIIKRFLNTAKVQSFQGPINSYAQSIKKKSLKNIF